MRPIDMLTSDAQNAYANGTMHLVITRAELRQLKDYELVVGTDEPDRARFVELVGLPDTFQLLVRDAA